MSLNHHKLYLDAVFALAKTIFVKSEYSAAQVNAQIRQLHGAAAVLPDQPETWKYYLNACGQYHPTDERMQVISLDTLQPIEFNKANLVLHPATARGYQYGSRYYKELLARFPRQESLILGILYPAEMAKVLAAPDFSIVSYNPSLVEGNEEQLIPTLSDWTQTYFRRWWVQGFNINHDLYAASFFAVFYQQLVLKILEIREAACGTSYAHSFHVRMHLAGYHGLDEFLPYLTFKQTMWLYRNIAYITRYAGWQSTFEWLVQNILTNRGLPLIGYDLVHDASNLLEGDTSPIATFIATAVNNVRMPENEFIDYRTILAKIAQAADGNVAYDLREPDAIPDMRYQVQNTYQTKILESSFVDVTENSAVSTIEMALSLWVYAACSGRFNVYTRINHPLTGSEITLSSVDAYYLFLHAYASCHASGMPVLPPLHARTAPVWPVPQADVLWAICDQGQVNPARITQMRDLMLGDTTFINLDQYRQAVEALEQSMSSQGFIVASADTFERQTSYKAVLAALWQDQDFIRAETGQNTAEYLDSKGIDLGLLDTQQWQEVYLSVFESVTGLDMQTTAAQSGMQTAMVEIMRRLSSYSVLFVDPLGSVSTRALGWSNLIVQEAANTSGNYYEVPIVSMNIQFVPTVETLTANVSIGSSDIRFWVDAVEAPQNVDHTSDIFFASEDHDMRDDIMLASVGVSPINGVGEIDDSFIAGLQEIMADPTSFLGTPNLYNSDCWPNPVIPTQVDPNDWLVIHQLPILIPAELGPQLLIDFRPFSIPQNLRYFSVDSGILELDAFESNYGDTPVAVFEALVGHEKLEDTFSLMPYFEPHLDTWEGSIGNVRTDAFDPYAAIVDYIELGAFVPVDLQHVLNTRPGGPLGVDSISIVPSGNASFSLNQGTDGLDVALTQRNGEASVGSLSTLSRQFTMSFSQNPVQTNIGTFYANILPFTLGTLPAKSAIYHMGSLSINTKSLVMPTLTHIGVLQINDLSYWGATHLAVSYDGPIFESYSTQSNADTEGYTTELHILDMQTELTLV